MYALKRGKAVNAPKRGGKIVFAPKEKWAVCVCSKGKCVSN